MPRSAPLLLLLLAALSVAVTLVNAQTCGYGGIDVSSLGSSVITLADPTNTYQFSVQVCGLLATPCAGTNGSASVCRTNIQTGAEDIMAAQPSGNWGYLDNLIDLGVSEYIEGGETCPGPIGPNYWNTFMNFACSTTPRPAVVVGGQCYYNITIYTPVACTSQPTECDFEGMNLEPITAPVYTYNDGQQYNYTFTVCRPYTSAENLACYNLQGSTGSACQQDFSGTATGQLQEIGMWSTPKWSLIESGNPSAGIQYVVPGTTTCVQPQGSLQYATTYQFPCAAEPGAVQVISQPGSCYFTFVLPTPYACPQPAATEEDESTEAEVDAPASIFVDRDAAIAEQ